MAHRGSAAKPPLPPLFRAPGMLRQDRISSGNDRRRDARARGRDGFRRIAMRLSARLARLSAFAATLSLAVALGIASAGRAHPAEITIFLNQATASGVRELGAAFEQATGHKVNVSFERGPSLNEKIVSGAPGDLVSLLISEFDNHLKSGKVVAGSVVEYGRVFNGVAVKA